MGSVLSRIAVSAMSLSVALAHAQAASAATEGDASGDRIVVTGTLIRGSAEDGPAPVEVIGGDELLGQGSPSILEIARRLPASSGVLGDSSQFDPRSQFNEGSASVNLRGLGPQRTLVLLNGQRMVASGAGNLPLVDLNLLPMDALDRIEILKDGAAATYGSDAIAGVVNFITRTDQEGFLASGDYRRIPGSGGDWTAAMSWGGLVGPARILVSGGYQRRSELRVDDRDFAMMAYEQNPQGGYSGGGNPGNFDFDATLNGTAFTADEGCSDVGAFRSLPGSTSDLCLANYLGFTNLVEPEDRFQLFTDVALPLSDTVELRVSGLYGRTETVLHTSPSFLPTIAPSANAAFGGTGLFTIPTYAPALIDYCARYGAAAGCAVDGAGIPQQPALAYPVRFRPMLLSGNPLFDNDRGSARLFRDSDSYHLTGELDAELSSSLDLRVGVTYSRYDRFFEVGDNYIDLLQNALAGFGGPGCAYATAASRAGLDNAQLAALAGTNGCTFFNPFSTGIAANMLTGAANPNFAGNGSAVPGLDTAPGAGLVNDLTTIGDFYNIWGRTANTSQWVADALLSGGSGIMLPGGELTFAVGVQYRRDRYARTYEGGNNLDLFPCPASVLDPTASCNPETGALGFIGSNRDVTVTGDVGALFAELQVPVTSRLDAQISARYERYSGSRSTFDPQVRLRYELTDWLALRGGAGTTFRGPPPQNTSADLVILTFIGGAFRAVDILANPDLKPESATTWNAGLLLDRGGLRASVDYWHYDFQGAIEGEPVSGMVAAMFGTSGTANCGNPAYAGLQARFTFSGGMCSSANVQRLATFAFNSADVTTSGLDIQASYEFDLGESLVQAGLSGSHVFEYDIGEVVVEGIAVQPAFDAAGFLNYQTTAYPIPRWKGQAWLQGEFGAHAVRLQANYVDIYTDQRAGIFGPNADLAGQAVTAGRQIGSYTTVDASWRCSLETGTTVSLALFNIFDTDPPFARLDQNFDPFTADPFGFTAKLGVSQAF